MKEYKVELYTGQEESFLTGALDLLGIPYTIAKGAGVISSTIYSFKCKYTDYVALSSMMKANFEKHFA